MEKHDVLLRTEVLIHELYDEINSEAWGYNNELYDKHMNDFFIISNALGELIQHRYSTTKSKEEFKSIVNNIIDKYFK